MSQGTKKKNFVRTDKIFVSNEQQKTAQQIICKKGKKVFFIRPQERTTERRQSVIRKLKRHFFATQVLPTRYFLHYLHGTSYTTSAKEEYFVHPDKIFVQTTNTTNTHTDKQPDNKHTDTNTHTDKQT